MSVPGNFVIMARGYFLFLYIQKIRNDIILALIQAVFFVKQIV
ncbi:hypothetical protein ASZ90_017825 [hydrocarbon metagenome]|uniref:Uncharacterized protein n=1 Tax=hydrocarbon metagenome TaxID=938273 RepID=A0A0W8E7S9_9ZZZZ